MSRSVVVWALFVMTILFGAAQLNGQTSSVVNVTTWHNDNGRTGQNTHEIHLTTGSFANHGFGLNCKISLPSTPQQEEVYAQPLEVANSDGSMTVYVATMQDNVYVFNVPATANWTSQTCAQLQSTTPISLFRGALAGQFPADVCFIGSGSKDIGSCTRAVCPSVGVLGTPVIDTQSKTMYLVTESQDIDTGTQGIGCPSKKNLMPNFFHYVHALDLTSPTLPEKFNGPVPVTPPTVGNAVFKSKDLLQRPGLLFLAHPVGVNTPSVYIGFSMMDGTRPNPNGWVLAYSGTNLGQGGFPLTFVTTPGVAMGSPAGGGIWQGGAGLAAGVDANLASYIYVSTGDGVFDANTSGTDYGDSFLKLNSQLQLSDYFTPADWDYRWDHACTKDGNDLDYGSAGEMLVPDGALQDSHYKNIVIKGEKESYIWVIDRTNPGKAGTGCTANCMPCVGNNNVLQQLSITGAQARSTPAYWNDGTTPFLYIAEAGTKLSQYKLNCSFPNGPICSPASATTATPVGYAATPAVSSNGTLTGTGIVWAIDLGGHALFAFDAESLATLFSSNDCPTNHRDTIGAPTKFSVPTIANGYVFVGTQTDFDIFRPTTATCN